MLQCPKCGSYLTEKQIIKTDAKYAPGNVAIEYNAQCPDCHVEMGRVSWGQLTVNPDIEKSVPKPEVPAEAVEPAAAPPGKVCPHCGKPLPVDF